MNGEVHGEGGGSPAERFWEEHYRASARPSNGRPSGALVRFAGPLPEGAALDLGCAQGDDAIWLAERGWRVVAVDVSSTVLARAAKNAQAAGVANLVEFQRHDLASTFPEGRFDLVSTLYLQSPVEFPRTQVLRAAARAVAPGGLLLIVEHASAAPWSWADPDTAFPTPEEALAGLDLDLSRWHCEFVGAPARLATGPNGQRATVTDNVIALRRPAR
ncbi:MAG TPA: class I SAM-dependent methyltransferase [Rubrobacter sp.]|nr:class I SAM-dependent methyltransferase [Rubrobacter sp.]